MNRPSTFGITSVTSYPLSTNPLAYRTARFAPESERGPARKMADFLTAVVAHGSDFDRPDDTPSPACFKCCKRDQRVVERGVAEDDGERPKTGGKSGLK